MPIQYKQNGALLRTLSALGLVFAAATSNVLAQAILTPYATNSPEGIQEPSEQRPPQKRLVDAMGVQVIMNEGLGRSTSALEAIPDSAANIVIQSESDIVEKVLPIILPLYGLSGTETVESNGSFDTMGDTHYEYREYIRGIKTPYTIRVVVDGRTNTIKHVLGLLAIDRGYDPTPEMSEDDAIEITIRHIRETERASRQNILRTEDPTTITTQAEFVRGGDSGLIAVWKVLVPLEVPDAKQPVFEAYTVYPDQTVRGGIGFDH